MLKFRGVLMPSLWWPRALILPASSMAKPEVADNARGVAGVTWGRVGVRASLAILVAARPGVLDEARRGPELAVGAGRKRGPAPAAVVGDEHVLAGLVAHQVARPRPDR